MISFVKEDQFYQSHQIYIFHILNNNNKIDMDEVVELVRRWEDRRFGEIKDHFENQSPDHVMPMSYYSYSNGYNTLSSQPTTSNQPTSNQEQSQSYNGGSDNQTNNNSSEGNNDTTNVVVGQEEFKSPSSPSSSLPNEILRFDKSISSTHTPSSNQISPYEMPQVLILI